MKLQSSIELAGPYYEYSAPYGVVHKTLDRDIWYVKRKLTKRQRKTEFQKITGESMLGSIVKFRNRKVYVISQLYPRKDFKTLKGAINFLVRNEGKLVFCT